MAVCGDRQWRVIHCSRSEIVGDGATDATGEIRRQDTIGLTAQRSADELPALPAVGERIVVFHAPQQEFGLVRRKRAIHHCGQLFAMEITGVDIAGSGRIG